MNNDLEKAVSDLVFKHTNAIGIADVELAIALETLFMGRVRYIRCMDHRAVPQLNHSGDGGSECGACEPKYSEAMGQLARAAVIWDGANEDGCAFCLGEFHKDDNWVLHNKQCPIVIHRLEMIAELVDDDPAPGTPDGKLLSRLGIAQERWEKAVFPSLPPEPQP